MASGKVIRIQTKQVRAVGRATPGLRLINLENGDKICSVILQVQAPAPGRSLPLRSPLLDALF
jgi:DNA gyrase/topoisomerase IV subunit A